MRIIAFVGGLILILVVLLDAFETVVLPRRVSHRFRLTARFYDGTWNLWRAATRRWTSGRYRESVLAFYGPVAVLGLLVVWDVLLIFGFTGLLWSMEISALNGPGQVLDFKTDLIASASSFITVGFGYITPSTLWGQGVLIVEGGMGLAFLALVIGYLPAVYQAFAQREANITMMDARAGSPPTAMEALRRCSIEDACADASKFLADWENWSAQLLETHLSYPQLAFYRSQHENQSWLAALAAILDTSALISIGIDGIPQKQGRLTFAMARHTIVDLAQIFQVPPNESGADRLSEADFDYMQSELKQVGFCLQEGSDIFVKLYDLRLLYEPYLTALADRFLMPIPGWFPENEVLDNWQTTAWAGRGIVRL
ncbi:MAG: potassium channel family protein [Anaerolineaceae bacterium]|nr:potassium channel family protein [Anaerolineaceae bacterium]